MQMTAAVAAMEMWEFGVACRMFELDGQGVEALPFMVLGVVDLFQENAAGHRFISPASGGKGAQKRRNNESDTTTF